MNSKEKLIEHLTNAYSTITKDGNGFYVDTVDFKLVNDIHLWVVIENTVLSSTKLARTYRQIMLYVLLENEEFYGFKELNPQMGLFMYDCPIEFLEKSPYEEDSDYCNNEKEWRMNVKLNSQNNCTKQ